MSLEQELNELKQKQAELRQRIRRMRNSRTEVRKLETKLLKQLGTAKWTIKSIKELDPDWDEYSFYQSAPAKQPAPRGRRRRTDAEAE